MLALISSLVAISLFLSVSIFGGMSYHCSFSLIVGYDSPLRVSSIGFGKSTAALAFCASISASLSAENCISKVTSGFVAAC